MAKENDLNTRPSIIGASKREGKNQGVK